MSVLIDKYVGIRLGVDLANVKPGKALIVESPRRLKREMSYGFVHALWWVRFVDGRSVVSVPPGMGRKIGNIVKEIENCGGPFNKEQGRLLTSAIKSMPANVRPPGQFDGTRIGLVFVCNAIRLRVYPLANCYRLADLKIRLADGIRVPSQHIKDGVAFGVIENGVVVSVAYAHRSGIMQNEVADVGVETALSFRRRGFARAAVSALVEDFAVQNGEAKYDCSPDNAASIATARSVGFERYAESLIIFIRGKESA